MQVLDTLDTPIRLSSRARDEERYSISEWAPVMEVSETSEHYVVRVELPGINKDNLKLAVVGSILTVRGSREYATSDNETLVWQERTSKIFERTIRLPGIVKESTTKATYYNGILTVKLAKMQPGQSFSISIA